jgi:hypothetical protein
VVVSVACRGDSEVLIVEDNRDAAEMLAERILTRSRIELLEPPAGSPSSASRG